MSKILISPFQQVSQWTQSKFTSRRPTAAFSSNIRHVRVSLTSRQVNRARQAHRCWVRKPSCRSTSSQSCKRPSLSRFVRAMGHSRPNKPYLRDTLCPTSPNQQLTVSIRQWRHRRMPHRRCLTYSNSRMFISTFQRTWCVQQFHATHHYCEFCFMLAPIQVDICSDRRSACYFTFRCPTSSRWRDDAFQRVKTVCALLKLWYRQIGGQPCHHLNVKDKHQLFRRHRNVLFRSRTACSSHRQRIPRCVNRKFRFNRLRHSQRWAKSGELRKLFHVGGKEKFSAAKLLHSPWLSYY